MASEAEVDLIISTADTLPQLERELTEIVRAAEADADAIELQALLDADDTLANLVADMDAVLRDAELSADPVEIQARLDQIQALEDLQEDLNDVIDAVTRVADDIEVDVALDPDVAALDAEIAALVEELEASAPEVDIQVDVDRSGSGGRALGRLGSILGSLDGPLKKVGIGIGGIAAAGAALPSTVALLGSIASAVGQIAPASALAVSGLIAVQLASGAVKLAMVGVEDAVTAAFDPEAKPEDLAKAMEGLAPAARSFVTQLAAMKSQLKDVQQTVQQNFFQGLDGALKTLGERTLPIVKDNLSEAATTLNFMAHEAASAALELGNNGTLGKALNGANAGLSNLIPIPGLVVTALGQIGAAAAPAFDRVTAGATSAATAIADKLSKAFESGALENSINIAVETIKQLGTIGKNVFTGLKNIMGSLTASGEGLFGTLEKVTKAFADVTGTKGFQDALSALSLTLNTVVTTVLPLLSTALQALGPVFQALGPPIQLLVKVLGDALGPVIEALGPVLVSVGLAFGRLVGAVNPLIALAGKLITAFLPILAPLFDALGQAINAMIPFVKTLADVLAATLVPLFTTIANEVLPALLPPLVQLSTAIFPVLTKILVALAPSLAKLAEVFGQVLIALTPLIVELANLTVELLNKLMPIIQPIIDLMIKLTTGALALLAAQISGVVIPAIRILVDLLKGDFSAAFEGAKTLVSNIWNKVAELTQAFVKSIGDKLLGLVGLTTERVGQIRDRAVQGFQEMVSRAAAEVGKLPGRLTAALGDLKGLLVSAGSDAVQGFINGLSSRLGRLREIASDIASTVKNAVGDLLRIGSPSRLMREMGQWTAEGFGLGMQDRMSELGQLARSMAATAPGAVGSLQLAGQTDMSPTVQVFLGNQLLDSHVDARIARSNVARDRLIINGGRR